VSNLFWKMNCCEFGVRVRSPSLLKSELLRGPIMPDFYSLPREASSTCLRSVLVCMGLRRKAIDSGIGRFCLLLNELIAVLPLRTVFLEYPSSVYGS
jgi:hypothetical protein